MTAQAGRPSCSCLKAFPLRGLLAAPGPECQVEPEPSTSGRPEGQEPEQAQSGHAGAASEAAAVEQWATSELMACADGTDIVGTCRLPQVGPSSPTSIQGFTFSFYRGSLNPGTCTTLGCEAQPKGRSCLMLYGNMAQLSEESALAHLARADCQHMLSL